MVTNNVIISKLISLVQDTDAAIQTFDGIPATKAVDKLGVSLQKIKKDLLELSAVLEQQGFHSDEYSWPEAITKSLNTFMEE